MGNQPRYDPLSESDTWPDHRSARPLVPGTVARGHLRIDDAMYKGKTSETLVSEFPITITREVIKRGQARFNIYCSPCHGYSGYGDGMIVHRGLSAPPSFHDDRMLTAPVGHFYDVISNGFGKMYDYSDKITPKDRWAIIAYIRALQLSQHATIDDVPVSDRNKLVAGGTQ
jgi:hypothetical protein